MSSEILILTAAGDETANRVAEALQRRGVGYARFDPGDFPAGAEVTARYDATGRSECSLRVGGKTINLDEVRVAWYRRPLTPVPHAEVTDTRVRECVVEESRTFLQDVWESLDCWWVPAPVTTIRRAELKGMQLKTAGSLGLELPSTVVTNSPDAVLSLYQQHDGRLVSKRVGSRPLPGWQTELRYSEPVGTRDIGYVSSARYCPTIFQAYVPKRVELRITVVGSMVFAAEIHSQEANRTRHDWRRYDLHTTPQVPHDLPDDVARRCVALVDALGLCYGAIDMVLTPDGRYVFLEINPNGQYYWVENLTGLPISEAICDLLISRASADRSPSRRGGEARA